MVGDALSHPSFRRAWALPIAAGLLCSWVFAQEGPTREEQYRAALKEGLQHYQKRRFERAAVAFRRAQRIAPRSWVPRFYGVVNELDRGRRLKGRARFDAIRKTRGMIDELSEATGIFQTDPLVLYLRGTAQLYANSHFQSYATLGRALASSPRRLQPYASVGLKRMLRDAYSRSGIRVGTTLIMRGKFEQARGVLLKAEKFVPEDAIGYRVSLQRNLAAAEEHLQFFDKAVARLRKCIELAPKQRDEFLGTIAVLYLYTERMEDAKKVLKEAGPKANHVEILQARAVLRFKEVIDDPQSDEADKAIDYLQDLIEKMPESERYTPTKLLSQLVRSAVTADLALEYKDVLMDTLRRLEQEVKLRPECPALYAEMAKLHRLLGNREKAAALEKEQAKREKELEKIDLFDRYGRPRC